MVRLDGGRDEHKTTSRINNKVVEVSLRWVWGREDVNANVKRVRGKLEVSRYSKIYFRCDLSVTQRDIRDNLDSKDTRTLGAWRVESQTRPRELTYPYLQ